MLPVPFLLPAAGLSLAAYEAGDPAGPPLLLLHGNSLAADVFERQWQAPALQGFRLVAFDLPGHGQSPPAPGHYGVAAMRTIVLEAVRALRLEHALVVAHSYGGNLLLELLPDLPNLRGLLTIGAPPVSTPAEMQAAFQLSETGKLFYVASLSATQVDALARYCLRPDPAPAEVALLAAAIARADGRARADLLVSIGAGEMRDEVGNVGKTLVPLALAVGEFDHAINFAYFDDLAAPSRWGGVLHVVPGSGHSPFLENPTVFNQLVLDFAAATSPVEAVRTR
ncbi:alpha/beta hydrolase [Hymenobacter ginsengisoli]|uniref:Alpha/beta hydrolase n=1 Tax=Hymenobacter ginsengisoli TaxID=1051626 RepID=A0ABP8QKM8_9BACT|nr:MULTISPECIES: alpha/beta hydrolase [unclassified Hymenobacter]MBO2029828.1 alpha/beta hydrolase [Hymenobacter sp. BT559]